MCSLAKNNGFADNLFYHIPHYSALREAQPQQFGLSLPADKSRTRKRPSPLKSSYLYPESVKVC
jgi:hypothetical protein